ncbi:MAG: hypothetical protein R6V03_02710 [Kiritimatiellia bacterium]
MLSLSVFCGLTPSVLDGSSSQVSADFPGDLRDYLQRSFGETVAVQYFPEASTRSNPLRLCTEETFSEARRLGLHIAEAVATNVSNLTPEQFTDNNVLTTITAFEDITADNLPSSWNARVHWGECRSRLDRLQEEHADPVSLRAARAAVSDTEFVLAMLSSIQSEQNAERILENGRLRIQGFRVGERNLSTKMRHFS